LAKLFLLLFVQATVAGAPPADGAFWHSYQFNGPDAGRSDVIRPKLRVDFLGIRSLNSAAFCA